MIPSRAALLSGLDAPVEARPYGEITVTDDGERESIWLHLTEAQASCLLTGYVPSGVKAVLSELVNYEIEDQKRADRPVATKARKKA